MPKLGRRIQGVVVSDKMDKGIVVEVTRIRRHRIYKKAVRRQRKFVAHDPENSCKIGDEVVIETSRPLSKTKRWRLREIVSRAELTTEEEAASVDTAAI